MWAHKGKLNIESQKTNEELDKLIKHKNIINYIKAQRLIWFGHVKMVPNTRTVKKTFNWKPLKDQKEDPSTDGRITSNRTFAN
jgi:ATP-dependent helicase/DNAse subunit B